jgi:uncharacterized protein (DUF1501 family)
MSSACNDWHRSRRRLLRDATTLVPLPTDTLEQAGSSGAFDRRDLLAGGLGLLLACTGLPGRSPGGILEAAAAEAAQSPDAPILVSVYLDGGNDGLNTLVPLADARYAQLRPKIGIAAGEALPLADTAEFGWHPSLTGLRELYDAGKVAVLPSVDYAHPDLSHFNSSAYWRTGVVGQTLDRSGWLGRTVDVLGSPDNPLQAISVSGNLDPILQTGHHPVATVFDPADSAFWIPGTWSSDAAMDAYRTVARRGRGARAAVQQTFRNAFSISDRLAPLAAEKTPAPPPLGYPDSELGKGLRNLGRMLGAGFGTRVAAVSAGGGYDTHDDQPGSNPDLLRDLGDSLAAWQADLAARGLAGRVLTMVWSEFGRRPEENDSQGTDHGAGGLVLLIGDRANGGVRSEFPGLGRLDENDNLLVSTDFRTVYATLLESWLGVEARRVLPRPLDRRLDLVRAAA